MVNYLIGVLLILHGLVHLLYFGHSERYYEMKPGLSWPDGSWIFTKGFEDERIRSLAKILCILAALGFIAGGLGYFT